MSDPAVVDQIIASNPDLAMMGPQVREVLQSEAFREMVYVYFRFCITSKDRTCFPSSNPERLQGMLQMASMMRGMGGAGPGANPFGGTPNSPRPGGFPAPGIPQGNAASVPPTFGQPTSPSGVAPASPFPFVPAAAGTGAAANPAAAAGTLNPFAMNPALLQQMMGMGASGFGGGFGGPTPTPTDARPPEERFQVQLQVTYLV